MNEQQGAGLPAPDLGRRRELVVEILCRAFAADGLDVAELEHRLDLAHRARTPAELDALTRDLPTAADPAAPAAERFAPMAKQEAAAASAGRRRTVAEPENRRRFGMMLAVLGGYRRRGHWTPPEHMAVIACMGGAELDFRDAAIGEHGAHVTAFGFCGGVEIIVPPEIRVEIDGLAVLGGFDEDDTRPEPPPAGAPVLRVDGLALLGGVSVTVRLPGESARDARRRGRELRRQEIRERVGRRAADRAERRIDRIERRLGEYDRQP